MVSFSPARALMLALAALHGVGDAALGEWRERGQRAVHVRRRLTPAEAAQIPGGLRDIRGTPEQAQRIAALLAAAPHLRAFVASMYDG